MTISLKTNRISYFNDLSEIIRLFFPQAEIILNDEISNDIACDISLESLIERSHNTFTAISIYNTSENTISRTIEDVSAMNVKRVEKRLLKITLFRVIKIAFDVNTPWGSLTGIRPTKLFRDMVQANGLETAEMIFKEDYDVYPEKISLLKEITEQQKSTIESTNERAVDVYINIPFCISKCLYCSFPSEILSTKRDTLSPYLDALYSDISQTADIISGRGYVVRSTYIGGGTPTVLSAGQLEDLFTHIQRCYGGFGSEFTVEAGRPDTIDARKLEVMAEHGVDRISINPQTMSDKSLQNLGRLHSAFDIVDKYMLARSFGFNSINMDLICGLPGEDVDDFRRSVESVAELQPDDLTVHTLALKRSSRLIDHPEQYPLPDAETVERMVRIGYETAESMGMKPYYMYRQKYMNGNLENVGYAKSGKICIYNIDMMEETTNIIAHGANGMSKRVFPQESRVERIPNPKDIKTYVEKLPVIIEEKRTLF